MPKDDELSPAGLAMLQVMRDNVRELRAMREEMAAFRGALAVVVEKLGKVSAGAGVLGVLGKVLGGR